MSSNKAYRALANRLEFMCHLNPIVMGELGEIGWYIKLEEINDKNSMKKNMTKHQSNKIKIKQPLFQFRYEAVEGKFIREIRTSLIDNSAKDPNFVNG